MTRFLVFASVAGLGASLQVAPRSCALRAPRAQRFRGAASVLRSSEVESAESVEVPPAASEAAAEGAVPVVAVVSPEEEELSEKQKEIKRLRAAEKFIEKETGTHQCVICDFQYDPAKGCVGAAPGTDFRDLTSSFRCPTCKCSKDKFQPLTVTIAGFAENQEYGFGGNNMTEGDKNALIFGSLGFFFALFLSGYLLT